MYARKRQYLHVFESEIGEEQQRKLAKYRKNAKSSGKTRKINLKRPKQANQLARKKGCKRLDHAYSLFKLEDSQVFIFSLLLSS